MQVLLQNCKTISLAVFALITLSSCHEYLFSDPIPVDRENLYEFPDEMIGRWYDTTNGTEEDGWYYVNKNNCGFIEFNSEKVLVGAWPKFENGKYIDPTWTNATQQIRYDSLDRPVDTMNSYFFFDSLVYKIDNDKHLSKGYRYSREKDTITIYKVDTTHYDLGKNVFLRQIDARRFALNIRNGWDLEKLNWWSIFILEKQSTDIIRVWSASDALEEHGSFMYRASDNYYINSKWTAKQVDQLMGEGCFRRNDFILQKIKKHDVVLR